MAYYIIIRECRANDKSKCSELLHNSIMSNVSTAFISTIFRELTFELIVLTSAVLFIFVGVPMSYCIFSIPIVILLVYFGVYISHYAKSMELAQQSRDLFCWVAEAFEPLTFNDRKDTNYSIITEDEMNSKQEFESTSFQRKIVGTVSIDKHRNKSYAAWIKKFAVDSNYRRKHIGSSLIRALTKYCEDQRFESIEVTTAECHEAARQLFVNSGFHLVQIYHKKLIVASIQKYHLGKEIGSFI